MTLTIYAYGHPILRQKTEEIDTDEEGETDLSTASARKRRKVC